MEFIRIRGGRTHNLANIDLDLPRDRLIVITGLSGSGKSSLAFDTLFAEGQRRYVESLSAYARQFLSVMEKPDVDLIDGLSPAISIEQKSASHNPRSTVGTITEVYDYLRLLFARTGIPRCPTHGNELTAQTISQMTDQVLALEEDTRLILLAPVVKARKGEHANLFNELRAQGFIRVRLDGKVMDIEELPDLELRKVHRIEVVVDRFKVRAEHINRIAESFETALRLANGVAYVAFMDKPGFADLVFSAQFACPVCSYSIRELEPRLFSFNNPAGACSTCDGLGYVHRFEPERVVTHPELSLAGGAVRGWDRRNAWYFQILRSLANHYNFDIEIPFEELPEKIRRTVLFGSGDETIEFRYLSDRGGYKKRTHSFEGIIPNMERRWRETESAAVREELGRYRGSQSCRDCKGTRLNTEARHVFVSNHSLPELTALPIKQAHSFFETLSLTGQRGEIATKIVKEISARLSFLVNVGLDYLTLDRSAETLSGGEAQRIRLASQIGSGLTGVMYILDEPSIGLHPRDNRRLLDTLTRLRDLGNTVIMVEHDQEAIMKADHVVDMGPGAGVHGGHVVAQGTPRDVMANTASLTGQYLSGKRCIPIPSKRQQPVEDRWLTIKGARGNNLKNLDVAIPVSCMTCVTGVSGSGKSTLINETLYRASAQILNRANENPADHDEILGLDAFDYVVDIDQSPIGRTPRSNPATYTGLFTPIRELFSATPESRVRGYAPGRFSFNVRGGRCEACQGEGLIKVEMHFLPDIYVPCDVCQAKRYNRETLEIRFKGKNIHEVLDMTVEDALDFFSAVPVLARKLKTLLDVGLSYIKLGQNATTLSGGEAQRVKLSRELSKRDTGRNLYILDEPTTGLHFHDVEQLLTVLHRLRNHGNTIVIIEHNLDVIKTADWIIDLGPEGGDNGGTVIASGPPQTICEHKQSYTGHHLAPYFSGTRKKKQPATKRKHG
ncbi:MAG: excinuclease ABC subunit UvrA [Gammaproteobacteria bacterium]|nr:MAG: excinuclease ABC subunit UvrA [Gammaproteobacteria bacterium]